MRAWLIAQAIRIAKCLLERLVKDDVEKTAAVGTLEREVNAANQAPSTVEEAARRLGDGTA